MAIKKFLPLLAENPLCGISEYKDVLDLSTGGVTRRIKKYVFTGEENVTIYSTGTSRNGIEITGISGIIGGNADIAILAICTHYQPDTRTALYRNTDNGISNSYQNNNIIFYDANYQTVDAFQQFCTQQYQNGTPVTVWYVLSTPETETITVPSGLTGTIEGYLTQSGTPTPSAPIYPEANPALVWAPTTYRKYGTETETITSLPAQIIGDGQPITSCQISGNTVQDGTPTPSDPVDVVGCGERTRNLYNVNVGMLYSAYVDTTGKWITSSDSRSVRMPCDPNTQYTLSVSQQLTAFRIYTSDDDDPLPTSSGVQLTLVTRNANISKYTFTTDNTAKWIIFQGPLVFVSEWNSSLMLNTGSTALSYEPYGYKLPISCGGTTTNVYLGEQSATRRIKKLVLDGTENWKLSSAPNQFYIDSVLDAVPQLAPMCTHFKGVSGLSGDNQIVISASRKINIRTTHIQYDLTDWINYLQQQYAAGTPVTIWYVLAEPETAVVNEPLHKIGDYADTVTATNIPTTGTAEQFDIQTTLKPSEVQLTYHGWHEHDDTKYTQGE